MSTNESRTKVWAGCFLFPTSSEIRPPVIQIGKIDRFAVFEKPSSDTTQNLRDCSSIFLKKLVVKFSSEPCSRLLTHRPKSPDDTTRRAFHKGGRPPIHKPTR